MLTIVTNKTYDPYTIRSKEREKGGKEKEERKM